MTAPILAALLLAWALWGVVLGWRRCDVVTAPLGGWVALGLVWAACGPLVVLLPRGMR